MCGSMVDIQSAVIRRGKKKERRNHSFFFLSFSSCAQDENIYGLPYYIGSHKLNERLSRLLSLPLLLLGHFSKYRFTLRLTTAKTRILVYRIFDRQF